MPNIPDINPKITIDAEQCLSMLLASVALEEMGLSHIINAEAEKIQYALGTLPGLSKPATFDEVLAVNDSVKKTLRGVMTNQMLLSNKLCDIIELYSYGVYRNIVTVTGEYNGVTVSSSDKAYFHTNGGDA